MATVSTGRTRATTLGSGARPRAAGGFTLVELLVALFALSLLAVMGWRGLDGMARTQAAVQTRSDEVLALQVGLAQWNADLNALVQLPQLSALDWNGRVLRLTRSGPAAAGDGVVVVAWTLREQPGGGQWLRWQSAPSTTRGEVEQAWQRALTWAQTPGDIDRAREVGLTPALSWQLFYFRGDAWTNPLSSDAPGAGSATPQGAPAAPGTPQPVGGRAPATPGATAGGTALALVPEGVRLVLTVPPGQPVSGVLTLDWVAPRVGGGKS